MQVDHEVLVGCVREEAHLSIDEAADAAQAALRELAQRLELVVVYRPVERVGVGGPARVVHQPQLEPGGIRDAVEDGVALLLGDEDRRRCLRACRRLEPGDDLPLRHEEAAGKPEERRRPGSGCEHEPARPVRRGVGVHLDTSWPPFVSGSSAPREAIAVWPAARVVRASSTRSVFTGPLPT